MIYGETGRCPLSVTVYVKCIRYWLQLQRMPAERSPAKAYKMLLNMHHNNKCTLASRVCYMLYRYGFGVVWENGGVGYVHQFLRVLKERLIESWHEEWHGIITAKAHLPADADRYRFYGSFKTSLVMSSYLCEIQHVQIRNTMIQFRVGVSYLKTHRLRFNDRSQMCDDALACPFCPHVEETELHFVLVCPKYTELRDMYIPRKFRNPPSAFRLALLFASTNTNVVMNVAKYIYEAFRVRNAA